MNSGTERHAPKPLTPNADTPIDRPSGDRNEVDPVFGKKDSKADAARKRDLERWAQGTRSR